MGDLDETAVELWICYMGVLMLGILHNHEGRLFLLLSKVRKRVWVPLVARQIVNITPHII